MNDLAVANRMVRGDHRLGDDLPAKYPFTSGRIQCRKDKFIILVGRHQAEGSQQASNQLFFILVDLADIGDITIRLDCR